MGSHCIGLILGVLLAAGVQIAPIKAQPLTLRAGILGGAAGIVTGPNHHVISNAGQPAAGLMQGDDYLSSIGVGPLVHIPSARDKKETARALLARHLDHPDSGVRRAIGMAVKGIDQSLDDALWSNDGNHVFNAVVFDKEAKAVRDVAGLPENESAGEQTRADALGALLRLVAADRILALIAIREAVAACADLESPEDLKECEKGVEKAQETLTDADERAAAGDYAGAIQEYRKAWELAVAYGGVGKSGGLRVVDGAEIPDVYTLAQNYPNPFNPSTTIPFSLPEQAPVRLQVFDALGRVVATIVETSLPPGSYRVLFDASVLPSGLYLYHLEAGEFTNSRRMIVLK